MAKGLGPGLPGVDHQRTVELMGQTDLRPESIGLVGPGRVFVVMVESRLTDRGHPRIPGERDQFRPLLPQVNCIVGVQPDRRHHVFAAGGQGHGRLRGGEIGTDAHHPLDPGRPRPVDDHVGCGEDPTGDGSGCRPNPAVTRSRVDAGKE